MKTILKVAGMNCGACVHHVTKALQSVAGVQSAQVELSSGTATVQHNESTKAEALEKAIEEAGYGAQAE